MKKFWVKLVVFIYFGSYLAMPKDFGHCCMRNFDIARSLIREGMLVQNFKAIN